MSLFDRIANAIAPAFGHAQSSAYWLVVIVIGAAAFAGLLYGRRFFWIFAGLLGFVVGLYLSDFVVAPLPIIAPLLQLAIAAVFGLLAVGFPAAVAPVLVFAGAGAAAGDLIFLVSGSRLLYWIVVPIAGLMGILALRSKYDESMILLTAFYSALLITFVVREMAPRLAPVHVLIVLLVLLVAGVVKQGMDLRRERRDPYLIPVSAGGVAPEKLS